ncbi:hypothetical protein MJO10_33685, partial [Salmonella enterica subsp. enterica serovar Anatum]|nr:hypothetical protein [Salmonella enterica subsp. enterica serovar Anatum]
LTGTQGTLRHAHSDKSAHAKIALFAIGGDICRFEDQFFALLIITTTTANPPHNNGVPTVFIISPHAKKNG